MVARVDVSATIPAPIADVYDAWTNSASLARWFKPSADARCIVLDHEPTPGGAWRVQVHDPAGGTYRVGGRYIELAKPHRLAFSWRWEAGGPEGFHDETTVRVELSETPAGTRVRVQHERVPPPLVDLHSAGWRGALDLLAKLHS